MKLFTVLVLFYSFSIFGVTTGEMAPLFSLKGEFKDIKLSDFKGRIIVLEWLNHGCPFVRKHYDSGNMQAIQKKYTDKGVVWLSIVSSAAGKQGFVNSVEAKKEKLLNKSHATDILLDPTGEVGKSYEAKTTPHMFIIDRSGKIAYQGAIDDKPDTEQSSISVSKNYIVHALDEILANKTVSFPTTKAYGCGIKH